MFKNIVYKVASLFISAWMWYALWTFDSRYVLRLILNNRIYYMTGIVSILWPEQNGRNCIDDSLDIILLYKSVKFWFKFP